MIVKPAKAAPLLCWRFVGILREAGLPEEWCQALLTGDERLNVRLAGDRRVGFFSFIGSSRVGWMLRSQLAPGTRCSLEHGGVAPVIVAADADFDAMVPLLVKGGFYHAGQVCVSVQRIFAAREVAEKLADVVAQQAGDLQVGDPVLPQTQVGPLDSPLRGRSRRAMGRRGGERRGTTPLRRAAAGRDVLCPHRALQPAGDDARVMTHEVFGPVVCVVPCDGLDEAIARANALPYAFQAAVFTRDLDTALRAARRLDASAVMVNDHTAFRVDWMPFAGLRESGLGVGGIPYTMKDMQIEKLVVIRSREL